ncbi:MAG: recombinase family protein, partial [Candidatus Gastranaerophilaceae bacterium]
MNGVIYARYSSDNQREESIEGQLRECNDFAKRNDITIVDSYIDQAFSVTTDKRPAFQKMIKDSAKDMFDVIIVWNLDRFAHNRYDSAYYKAQFRKNGVKVISANENISEGSEGIILESVLEGMVEYYSADLSEKVISGLTENAMKCKFNGGPITFGYYIEQGITTESTKKRLQELEGKKMDIEIEIAKEQIAKPKYTREQYKEFFEKSKVADL